MRYAKQPRPGESIETRAGLVLVIETERRGVIVHGQDERGHWTTVERADRGHWIAHPAGPCASCGQPIAGPVEMVYRFELRDDWTPHHRGPCPAPPPAHVYTDAEAAQDEAERAYCGARYSYERGHDHRNVIAQQRNAAQLYATARAERDAGR